MKLRSKLKYGAERLRALPEEPERLVASIAN